MKERELSRIANSFKNEAIVPFWMWNDRLEKEEILRQLHEIKSKGMNQVIIHPRFGLETPYLSEEWFEAVSWVIEEAERRKMGIWIYDELNWPSGYAGGRVLEKYPDFQATHLVRNKDGFEKRKSSWKPAYSDTYYYIDVLNPRAVHSFIDEVYERYWQKFGRYFGKTILGFFTDEPGMYNNFAGVDTDSIPWTDNLPEFFKKVNGYNLEERLDLIWKEADHRSIETRIDFWRTVSLLYQESYFRQLQSWCHQHGVLFIGHVLMEESLVDTAKTQGDFFSTMDFLDFAGYDLLNRLEPKTIIAAKLAQSASKHLDLYGVCAETFGIFGWDLTKEEMAQVVRWQADMGLDVLLPHALYYSVRGERYDDCPPSFMVDKYWQDFDDFVKQVRSFILDRAGKEIEPMVGIYYPIETIWGYLHPSDTSKAELVDLVFKSISFTSYNIDLDFDYVNSAFMEGQRDIKYKYLILPKAEVLPLATLRRIAEFIDNGGEIVIVGAPPKFATKEKDQREFSKILESVSSRFRYIIPEQGFGAMAIRERSTKNIKNLLNTHIPPIWLARAIRLARLLGYKKALSLIQKTGMEDQLRQIVLKR